MDYVLFGRACCVLGGNWSVAPLPVFLANNQVSRRADSRLGYLNGVRYCCNMGNNRRRGLVSGSQADARSTRQSLTPVVNHYGSSQVPPQTTPNPCPGAGNAPSPQQYQSQGQQSDQRQAYLNSVDDGSGGAASAGLILGLGDLLSFHRGGALDAQAYGSTASYANYVYGDYLSAAGYSQSTALFVANTYAFFFGKYSATTVMSPAYPSTPARNVSNINSGFNAQQSGTLCTKH